MRPTTFFILWIAFLMTGCATIQPKKIVFNNEKGIYEYQVNRQNSITLRNENQQLVDTANYESFKNELARIKDRYPFRKRIEIDHSLKRSDFELARRYGVINQLITEGNYRKSLVKLNTLPSIYMEIDKYSDWYYLKGYAYEKLGLRDSSQIMYDHFLKYSSQKFSSKFRGHRDDDPEDRTFIAERNHAKNYLLNQKQGETVHLSPIQPKYYFGSLQPGYTMNNEDMARHSRGILMFLLGNDFNGDMTGGFQYYYKINDRFNFNVRYASSNTMKEFSLALPIQLYKSRNNQFGLKFTPFMNYFVVDSAKIDGQQYLVNENVMNFGARLSAGYYPCQNLAIGAYYQANFYNENHPFQSKKTQIEMWMINEYDVSLYYNISKGFSLKSGVKNNDLVAGIVWYCWEISYDFTNPGLIFRIDMY